MFGIHMFLKEYLKVKHFSNFKNREDIEKYHNKKIQALFNDILPKSNFYSTLFKDFELLDWRNLPTINKSIMMDNFDTLNTVGITKEKAFNIALKCEETRDFSPKINGITVGLSSGTSGNRGIFLVSDHEKMAWAGNIIAKAIPSSILFGETQRIAFFLRANSNLYTSLNGKKISFKFFDLLNEIEKNITELDKFKPTILVAPPSMLRMLAKAVELKQLNINPVKIISVAEVLDPFDKNYISMIFNQTIHQIYQCTEGFLAHTCEYGTLHLNEDILVIQKKYLSKEDGKFSPIITDFTRRTQPIIRYELNDILTEKNTPCPCGSHFTALEHIEGRCDDLFYFNDIDNDKLKEVFPDFIRRAVITSSNYIDEYKVIQDKLDHIVVELLINNSEQRQQIENVIKNNIANLLIKQKCKIPMIEFSYNYTHQIKGVKLKRIERKFQL